MNPQAGPSKPITLRRDRTDRRQYQSCDRCRKARRGCDAVSLGIDPFDRGDLTPSSHTRRHGCSRCKNLNQECTFDWLKSIPRQVLPRRLTEKRKLSEQSSRDRPCPVGVFSSTRIASQPESSDTGINVDDVDTDLGLEALSVPVYGLPLTVDHQLRSIWPPTLLDQANAESFFDGMYGFVSVQELGQDDAFGGQGQSYGPKSTAVREEPAFWIEDDNDRIVQTRERFGHDQAIETAWGDERYSSQQGSSGLPISVVGEIEEFSFEGQHDLPEVETYQNEQRDPFLGGYLSASSAESRTTEAQLPTSLNETRRWPTMSMQEHRLADKSNKITISNDLMKIYCESLENALECWIDRETCPYRSETDIASRSHIVADRGRLPSISTTLYNRVCKLDAAFSRQRPRSLTRAEDSGSSKALKLSVMAFASQWSRTSRSLSSDMNEKTPALTSEHNHAVEPPPNSDFEASGAQEFEHLLRVSVWHESQRCLGRWRHCGSFRVILASIVLFCTHPPLDEDEWNDLPENDLDPFTSQDLEARTAVRTSLGPLGDQLTSSAPSSNATGQDVTNKLIPNLFFYSSSFYGYEGSQHLEIALGHLLDWRKAIQSSRQHQEQGSSSYSSPGSHYLIDFNLIFWLGVMCDTTRSVINQRSLIMPDTETFTSFSRATRSDFNSVMPTTLGTSSWRPGRDGRLSHPQETTRSVDIWGSYFLDIDRLWRRNLATTGKLTTSELRSQTLQRSVPLKLLFWRKVGRLQTMISSREGHPTLPTPTEIENAIKEALAVHQYWTANYSGFFTACIKEHSDLSFQFQSWYLVLVLGWNLACIILARCIDFIDGNEMSERLGQSLRATSVLTCELRRTSAYAIAEAAKVSYCPPISTVQENDPSTPALLSATSSHPALLGKSALLADPHTEKVVKALEMATETLLDCLRQWRYPAPSDSAPHLSWLYTNTSSDEISRHCVSCINALDLLKCKSDASRLTTKHLIARYRLVNGDMG